MRMHKARGASSPAKALPLAGAPAPQGLVDGSIRDVAVGSNEGPPLRARRPPRPLGGRHLPSAGVGAAHSLERDTLEINGSARRPPHPLPRPRQLPGLGYPL